ncbi:DUF3048 domain-containing protein [Fictibacillus sp. CENA-BCM004]|uniref:DUF3048 domain-containing protein n=2 Tax=Fictibacillus terranigra TaxID=3058424 RepID=A0ABT8EAC7_9BACL|nr:DUF3048 domain-containing protein [Fictibacillus sp. CENA-BCM004]MDN4074868.1 DUF3048 domain-containing protein [Fictibacillus sp. CENA-BCM004]
MKKWMLAICTALLILGGAGCQKDEKASNKKPAEHEKAPEKKEKTELKNTYPLTGIKTNKPTDARVFAVMVNNHQKARPQSGLHKADLVYEVLAEGDITRFLAVFQSEKPKVVGPVRSARNYFIELSQGFHSFYIHHGWSPEAKKILSGNSDVDSLNGLYYDGTLFQRASFRQAPHNSYIAYKDIMKGLKKKGYDNKDKIRPLPFLNQAEAKALTGDKADKVLITYNHGENVSYTYDSSTKRYARSSNGKPTTDRETETPIEVDNVFIVEAAHRIIDSYGRREIDLTSAGKAILLQCGKAREVSWENKDGRIIPSGTGFVPGKTWINIIPTQPGISKSVSIE